MQVEIRPSNTCKGKGLFTTTNIEKGSTIFEENPFVSCQFAWNAYCKYKACDHCLRPLETAEENARRLTGNPDLDLPFPPPGDIVKDNIVSCPSCGIEYCSEACKILAAQEYHQTLCIQTHENQTGHPLEQLADAWKQIHYPPETSSIFLIMRLLAKIIQSPNKEQTIQEVLTFCHSSINEDKTLILKLLENKFSDHIVLLRELVKNAIPNDGIEQFLTVEGFQNLLALLGTNGQGIGSSAVSVWRTTIEKLWLPPKDQKNIDYLVKQLYTQMFLHSGEFLNNEGVGLYTLQSCLNHSCVPNVEIKLVHNNYRISVIALEDIGANQELFSCYLSDCDINRSRHSRQKILMENYIFKCDCSKCLEQSADPDLTSDDDEYCSDEDCSDED